MSRQKRILLYIILASLPSLSLFQSCSNDYKLTTTPVAASNQGILSISNCSFNGQAVLTGQSVNAFLNSSVPFGQSCVSQPRLCTNGLLSGTYAYNSCSVGAPQACLFNGQTIVSGAAITAYESSNEPYGQACVSQSRTCTNGQLSGSYTFAACAVGAPASCLFNGQTVNSGSSITGYQTSSVPYGQTCASQSELCTNGQLAGTYTFASCDVGAPVSCLFNGQTVTSGSSITGYQAATVPFGQTCASQSELCTNGQLAGTYTFASCEVESPQSCSFNGQTIASGSSVTVYQSATVPYGQTCVSQSQLCTNGQLAGTYTSPSCTVTICDPFTNPSAACTSTTNGLIGSIFYEPPATVAAQGGWSQLATYFSSGTQIPATLLLSQLNIPTENFSVGFPIGNGQFLTDNSGNILVEWFAIQVKGILTLASTDAPGNYEFATLSDDGSILYMRDATSGQLVQQINNDGTHSTKLVCTTTPIYMDQTTQIPMELQYFQGPRTEIALRMLYRPVTAATSPESLCGKTQSSSAEFFIDSGAGDPYPEGPAMQTLYNDGWKVLAPANFLNP